MASVNDPINEPSASAQLAPRSMPEEVTESPAGNLSSDTIQVPLPAPIPVSLGGEMSSITAFYNHHCYPLLAVIVALNLIAGAYLFFSSPQTAWTQLAPLIILTMAVPPILYGFVEQKNEIHLSKRIATLAVAVLVPAIQWKVGAAKDAHYEERSRIENADDIVLYRDAFEVVKANDYQPGSKAEDEVRKVIPTLEDLSKRYPYHRQILYALGLAQFETHQFEEARKTFDALCKVSPNDFEPLYHLGITLKMMADTIERDEYKKADKDVPGFGSPTAPWAQGWQPPSKDSIGALRRLALARLEESLDYYYESPAGAGENFGPRIARNIGWLYYQLNDGTSPAMCQLAIEWHEKAIGSKKDQHFSGNPRYVLAYVNLGEIYRTLGQVDKSYKYLDEALRIHQDMRTNNSTETMNRDYRYLYLVLAKFLRLDGRDTEALDVERKGIAIFGSDNLK